MAIAHQCLAAGANDLNCMLMGKHMLTLVVGDHDANGAVCVSLNVHTHTFINKIK